MTPTHSMEQPTFTVSEEVVVRASIDRTFESLVMQMGPYNESPDGKPLPMVLEARPGGRWYRDLGGDNGHLWGLVQSIRRPDLLEVWGPLFLSTATSNNLIYRLRAVGDATVISFTHTLVGPVPDEVRARLGPGWQVLHARVKRVAESRTER